MHSLNILDRLCLNFIMCSGLRMELHSNFNNDENCRKLNAKLNNENKPYFEKSLIAGINSNIGVNHPNYFPYILCNDGIKPNINNTLLSPVFATGIISTQSCNEIADISNSELSTLKENLYVITNSNSSNISYHTSSKNSLYEMNNIETKTTEVDVFDDIELLTKCGSLKFTSDGKNSSLIEIDDSNLKKFKNEYANSRILLTANSQAGDEINKFENITNNSFTFFSFTQDVENKIVTPEDSIKNISSSKRGICNTKKRHDLKIKDEKLEYILKIAKNILGEESFQALIKASDTMTICTKNKMGDKKSEYYSIKEITNNSNLEKPHEDVETFINGILDSFDNEDSSDFGLNFKLEDIEDEIQRLEHDLNNRDSCYCFCLSNLSGTGDSESNTVVIYREPSSKLNSTRTRKVKHVNSLDGQHKRRKREWFIRVFHLKWSSPANSHNV